MNISNIFFQREMTYFNSAMATSGSKPAVAALIRFRFLMKTACLNLISDLSSYLIWRGLKVLILARTLKMMKPCNICDERIYIIRFILANLKQTIFRLLPYYRRRSIPIEFADDHLWLVFSKFYLLVNTIFFRCFGSSKAEFSPFLKIRICDPYLHHIL